MKHGPMITCECVNGQNEPSCCGKKRRNVNEEGEPFARERREVNGGHWNPQPKNQSGPWLNGCEGLPECRTIGRARIGDGPHTVSESAVSSTELNVLCPLRVPGRELSEFLSASDSCAQANSPSLLQNSVSLFRNSTLETASRLSPSGGGRTLEKARVCLLSASSTAPA